MIRIVEGRGRRFPHLISHRRAVGQSVLLGEGDSLVVVIVMVVVEVGMMMMSLHLLQRGSALLAQVVVEDGMMTLIGIMIDRVVTHGDQILGADGTTIGETIDMRAGKEEMVEEDEEEEAGVGEGEVAGLHQGAEEGGNILALAGEVEVAGEMTGEKKNARR